MPPSRYEIATGRTGPLPEGQPGPRSVNVPITSKQRMFLEAPTRGRIYCGGVGSGKSRILTYWAILQALSGKRGALVSFSYRNLLDVLTVSMFDALQAFELEPVKDWLFYKGDMAFIVGGCEIMLRSADDPNRLRGLNLHYFGLDEAREFRTREVFDVLIGRLRNSEEDQWALSSTSSGRNWFWQLARQDGLEDAFNCGYGRGPKLTVIVQSSWENTFLPKAYLQELQARYSHQLAEQELYGRIIEFTAGVFQRKWFEERLPPFKPVEGVRYWDLAYSVKTRSDLTAGVLLTRKDGVLVVADVLKAKTMDLHGLICGQAMIDGPGVVVAIESIGAQAGVGGSVMSDPRLHRHKVILHKPDSDKWSRIKPLVGRFEAGAIRLMAGPWNQDFVEECCEYSAKEDRGHDDCVDACAGAYAVINRDPTVIVPPEGQYGWPDPKNPEEAKAVEHICVVEVKDFVAHVVGCRFHPYRNEMELNLCAQYTVIADLARAIRPYQRRFGGPEMDSTEYKSLAMAMSKEKAAVMVGGRLDPVGALYEWNRLVKDNRVMIKPGMNLGAEMAMATPDEMSPAVRCALRLAQETRVIRREIPRPLAPFERKRKEYRDKQVTAQAKKDGWVG